MEKDQIMTTKELADYIKLNEKTIIKMAQKGTLPGKKIGNQWRFYLSAIDEYLQDNIVKSSDYDLSALTKYGDDIIPLSRLINKTHIKLDLRAKNRESILIELAQIAQNAGLAGCRKKLFIKLKEREDMLSTAIGNGVAIPHPRNPDDDLFKKPGVIIARSINGADFAAPDDKKVHLFFMTCAPDVILHLKLLSKIAKLLNSKNIFQRFMKVVSPEEVIKILLEEERININDASI